MVISFRAHNKNIEVARYKAIRAMNIAFVTLFLVVFFYAVSFNLALGHDQAVEAYQKNVSTLAIAAQNMDGTFVKVLSLVLNIFAVMTAFFGVFLGFKEACQGIAVNVLKRFMPEERINKKILGFAILIFAVLAAWGAIVLNVPVLSFTSICSPIFGMIGCLIPAYLVIKVPALHEYRNASLVLIVFVGILLVISPFLAFLCFFASLVIASRNSNAVRSLFMCENADDLFVQALKENVLPATGCTEPVAVAYAAATARSLLDDPTVGAIEAVKVQVSPNIMKNDLAVIVPGTGQPGLKVATAAGIVSGDCKAGLKVIADIREDELSAILDLARSGKITVSVAPVDDDLYVELRIVEAKDDAIVTIAGDHTDIFRIEENGIRLKDEPRPAAHELSPVKQALQKHTLREIWDFSLNAPFERIAFMEEAGTMNMDLAEKD